MVFAAEEEGLSPAQWVFALAYLENGFNGTQAYLRAHPESTNNTARVEAGRYLAIPAVRAFLAKRLEEEWGPLEASAAEAVGRIGAMSRAHLGQLIDETGQFKPLQDWPKATLVAVKEYDRDAGKVKFVDPLAANRLVLEITGRLKNPLAEAGDALGDAIKRMMERREANREG